MENYYPAKYEMSSNDLVSGNAGNGYANSLRLTPVYPSSNSTNSDSTLDELAEQLEPVHMTVIDPVTEQVFGAQIRQTQNWLDQSNDLIKEREALYRKHIRDIDHRHFDIQGQLFGARLHAHEDGHQRALRLQQTMVQLESDRRQEALACWKDTTDLRKTLLEHANEYDALRHRVAMLAPAETWELPYG